MLAIIDNQRGASRVKNILLLSLSLSHNNWQFEAIFCTSTLYFEIYILQTRKNENTWEKKEYSQLKLKSECIFIGDESIWDSIQTPNSTLCCLRISDIKRKIKWKKFDEELFWCYAWLCVLILIFNHKLYGWLWLH